MTWPDSAMREVAILEDALECSDREIERLRNGISRIAWRMHLAIGTSDEDIQCILDHMDDVLDFEAPE